MIKQLGSRPAKTEGVIGVGLKHKDLYGPRNIAKFRLKTRQRVAQDREDSIVELVVKAIGSVVSTNQIRGLQINVEGDGVSFEALVQTFYVRQLIEHKCRSIVVDQLHEKFVSRVVVQTASESNR